MCCRLYITLQGCLSSCKLDFQLYLAKVVLVSGEFVVYLNVLCLYLCVVWCAFMFVSVLCGWHWMSGESWLAIKDL